MGKATQPLRISQPGRAKQFMAPLSALPPQKELDRAIKLESKMMTKKEFRRDLIAGLALTIAGLPAKDRAAVAAEEKKAMKQVAQIGQGEPDIVTLGWAATCAMFTSSIALVIWGRSGI